MSNLKEFLTIEYESAYDLLLKINYLTLKIYTAISKLNKLWHIYISFKNYNSRRLK